MRHIRSLHLCSRVIHGQAEVISRAVTVVPSRKDCGAFQHVLKLAHIAGQSCCFSFAFAHASILLMGSLAPLAHRSMDFQS